MNVYEIIAPSFWDILDDILDNKHIHYWLKGGRASTKSSFVSIVIILLIMLDKEANAVVLRKISNTLQDSVFNQMIWAIDKLGLSSYWEVHKSPMELIYRANGKEQKIIFRGSDDPIKLKSTKFKNGFCKVIWYEECSEFNGMEEIRSINQTFMRGGENYKIFYTYNPPKSINNWVNMEVLEEREDKLIHTSTYLDVPKSWLGEQFFIEAEHLKKTKPLAYRNEYLGEATGTGGSVFDNVKIRHIEDEELERFDNILDGIDFGYAVDPTCYLQCHFDKTRKKLYIFNEIYKYGLRLKDLFNEINEIKIGRSYITCDSAEPRSIDELRFLGLDVEPAKKGPDSIEYGIKFLQSLEEIVIDNVRCPNTAKEFTSYEYEQDKYGNFKSKYPDENNHSIDACRYAIEEYTRNNTLTFGFNRII